MIGAHWSSVCQLAHRTNPTSSAKACNITQSPFSTTVKKPIPEPAAREINAKSDELIAEFFEHVRKFRKHHPGDHDPRKIFESWAIQKIAALQHTVLHLATTVAELQQHVRAKAQRRKNN
jgi:hypothetical protein